MNLKTLLSKGLMLLVIILSGHFVTSCTDPETTDSTKFAIFYSGVTDIGPSMNFNLNSPTYIGAAPSDFAITGITLDNETYSTDCFVIDTNSGSISLQNTEKLPVGTYKLTIACTSNGNRHEFKDAVTVNMLAPVPDGITVEPNEVTVDFTDIDNEDATAQVTTDNSTHVSITKYEIIQEEGYEYFAITQTGKISINKNYKGEIPPGKYTLNLKLTTGAGAGIFENAVTFNIISKPLSLIYTPNSVKAEKNSAYVTTVPVLKGSLEELAYSIKSVTPENAPITIDPTTGVLSLSENNGLEIDTECKVSISVTNKYGSTDFDEAFIINIVAFINPITTFSYDNQEEVQGTAFTFSPTEIDGDQVSYEFVNLPAELNGKLNIDEHLGVISAKKGNTIQIKNYTIQVKAHNAKSEKITSFNLNIKENENYFTYIRYGNNLGLDEAAEASQYRVNSANELQGLSLEPKTDAKNGVQLTWSVVTKHQMSGTTIDSATGKLSLKGYKANQCGVIIVTATAGKGTPAEVSVNVPVFFNFPATSGVKVLYSPFAFRVNPAKGGISKEPTLEGVSDPAKFAMDYRRTFNYYNVNGELVEGTVSASVTNTFLAEVFRAYYGDKNPNYGSKDPLSYYSNSTNLSQACAYVDQTANWAVKVNPGKWKNTDGVYADGAMIGQMTLVTNGDFSANSINGGTQVFPFIIWFDPNF
ncbi:surface glycan-binding family protein [Bacteroides sp. GM023]|uniref:surface glycan-binding family protein n=1 Tax=Bacteroides sp. GM023 TaxID=2723058 RepID=UPI00168A7F3E|nr:surface glycan-binding family protein [Bacteroides sp. GM023]MBD3591805.1 DUF4958 family protein [Bacteroides sp. GM023]